MVAEKSNCGIKMQLCYLEALPVEMEMNMSKSSLFMLFQIQGMVSCGQFQRNSLDHGSQDCFPSQGEIAILTKYQNGHPNDPVM